MPLDLAPRTFTRWRWDLILAAALVAAAIFGHAIFPRYELIPDSDRPGRYDRWTGTVCWSRLSGGWTCP